MPHDRYRLLNFNDIGAGTSTQILPSSIELIREKYFNFPVTSESLRPIAVEPMHMSNPAFNIFNFPIVQLKGFRLFNIGENYFSDLSLVDATKDNNERFWSKINTNWGKEDLDIRDGMLIGSIGGAIHDIDLNGAVILGSDEPSNFGSWIFRILPKLLLSQKYLRSSRFFIYQGSPWMKKFIEYFAPGSEIIDHWPQFTYNIRNATIPSLAVPEVFFRSEIRLLLDEIVAQSPTPASGFERIYISRRKQALRRPSYRILENETELVERLRILGFVETFPEDLTIGAQIAVFSRAKVIVSVGGANLFPCAFARAAELILDLESSPNWLYAHMNLLASSLRPFSMVEGERLSRGTGEHLNWRIDAAGVVEGLRRLGL